MAFKSAMKKADPVILEPIMQVSVTIPDEYLGDVIGDFPRDGEWHEFDVPLAKFASAIAAITMKADMDVFSVLSGGTVGAQLNLDAIYFYEKK